MFQDSFPLIKTGKFAGDSIEAQTAMSLDNVKNILKEAGIGLENVVQATVYLSDIADFADMNGVYAKYFTENCPARAAFQVAALPMGAKVEIAVIAVK